MNLDCFTKPTNKKSYLKLKQMLQIINGPENGIKLLLWSV